MPLIVLPVSKEIVIVRTVDQTYPRNERSRDEASFKLSKIKPTWFSRNIPSLSSKAVPFSFFSAFISSLRVISLLHLPDGELIFYLSTLPRGRNDQKSVVGVMRGGIQRGWPRGHPKMLGSFFW